MDYDKMCMGCMAEKPAADQVCPCCGFDERQFRAPAYSLCSRSILNGKYMTGRFLEESGYFITYLGWDLNLEVKVLIHEYYPCTMLFRDAASQPDVSWQAPDGEAFGNGKKKFYSRAKILARMWDLPGIVSVKDVFEENNTVYMVTEFYKGILLDEKLKAAGGRLGTDIVLNWMRPVMEAVSRLNREGIICMGISPGNILITVEGNAKLKEIWNPTAISPYDDKGYVPAGNSYLAEEEYRKDIKPGPWTNVYAICAVIYRCITGTPPPKAMERIVYDSIMPPSRLGYHMGSRQEEVLMRGLSVHVADRLQNMDVLMQGMYGGTESRQVPSPGSEDITRPIPPYAREDVTRPLSSGGIQSSSGRSDGGQGTGAAGTGKFPWRRKWPVLAAAAVILLCGSTVFFIVKSGGTGGKGTETGTVPLYTEAEESGPARTGTERAPDGGKSGDQGRGISGNEDTEGSSYSWDSQDTPDTTAPPGGQDNSDQNEWVYGGADFPYLDSVISRITEDKYKEYAMDEIIEAENYIKYLVDHAEISRDEQSRQNYLFIEIEMSTTSGSPFSSLQVEDYNFVAAVMDESEDGLMFCLPAVYFMSSDEETPREFPVTVGSESAGEMIFVYPIPDGYEKWAIIETNMYNGEEAGPLQLVSDLSMW